MRIVTKYAMLALFSASFIALNNCGNQSGSTSEQATNEVENGPAADFAILGGAPIGYPALAGVGPLVPVEINCNDGVDGDGDGFTDCMDTDCHVHPECAEYGPPLEEIINERTLTVYPNGLIVPEDIALLKARGFDDDDAHGWLNNQFFAGRHFKDCWIDPRQMDPYYTIPLGEALVAGPEGAIGPQLYPSQAVSYFGPRAGLINECEFGTDLMFWNVDDDNNDWDSDDDDEEEEDDSIR
jgi:hypothetical protein